MQAIELLPIRQEGFSLEIERGVPVCLRVSGNADMEMLPVLGPYLNKFHALICRAEHRLVKVDYRELYFMNSSCIKAFLTWIAQVVQLDASERYAIRFVCNSNLTWQRRSVYAMQAFAPAVIEIEES